MKIYCHHCGAAIHCSIDSKPNFCHKCGTNLSEANAPTKTDEAVKEVFYNADGSLWRKGIDSSARKYTELQMKGTESLVTDWQLNGLKVDIQKDSSDLRTFKFEDVIGTLNSEAPQSNDDFIAPKVSNADVLKQIQKEAGTLRKKK